MLELSYRHTIWPKCPIQTDQGHAALRSNFELADANTARTGEPILRAKNSERGDVRDTSMDGWSTSGKATVDPVIAGEADRAG